MTNSNSIAKFQTQANPRQLDMLQLQEHVVWGVSSCCCFFCCCYCLVWFLHCFVLRFNCQLICKLCNKHCLKQCHSSRLYVNRFKARNNLIICSPRINNNNNNKNNSKLKLRSRNVFALWTWMKCQARIGLLHTQTILWTIIISETIIMHCFYMQTDK